MQDTRVSMQFGQQEIPAEKNLDHPAIGPVAGKIPGRMQSFGKKF
jgi:hypothetical protein